jgi:hypothetical protein
MQVKQPQNFTQDQHMNLATHGDAGTIKGLPNKVAEDLCTRFEDGNLANIESLEENQLVHEMCRSLGQSIQTCWLGLTDNETESRWVWSDKSNNLRLTDSTYRNWMRGEPSNAGHAEAYDHEDCAAVQSHSSRGIPLNRGEWNDLNCGLEQPFICQTSGETNPKTLNVHGRFNWTGGTVSGNGFLRVKDSGSLLIKGNDPHLMSDYSHLVSNSTVWADGQIDASEGAQITNTGMFDVHDGVSLTAGQGAVPTLYNEQGAVVKKSSPSTTLIEASFINKGRVLAMQGTLDFAAGGLAAPGSVLFTGLSVAPEPTVRLSAGRFEFTHVETQTITVAATAPILAYDSGYFKVGFKGNETSCLRYHAEAEEVQAALNALPSIVAVGRVKVSRVGDGGLHDITWGTAESEMDANLDHVIDQHEWEQQRTEDPRFSSRFDINPGATNGEIDSSEWAVEETIWKWGYQYVVSFDQSDECSTQHGGPGGGCDLPLLLVAEDRCSDVYYNALHGLKPSGESPDNSGYLRADDSSQIGRNYSCEFGGAPVELPSEFGLSSFACATKPRYSSARQLAGGIAEVLGEGQLEAAGGSHFLPHIANAPVKVTGGEATVSSLNVELCTTAPGCLSAALVVDGGTMIFSGTGFEGVDAAVLLYSPTSYGGRVSAGLLAPPTVHVSLTDLEFKSGSIQVIGTKSDITLLGNLLWESGTFSGTCTLSVDRYITMTSPMNKIMKNAFQIVNYASAEWFGGHIIASEGSLFLNSGILDIRTTQGDSSFLAGVNDHAREWNNGWYPNPKCVGFFCEEPAVFVNEGLLRKIRGNETRFEGVFDNNGIVEVYHALLTLDGNGTMTGDEVVGEAYQHVHPNRSAYDDVEEVFKNMTNATNHSNHSNHSNSTYIDCNNTANANHTLCAYRDTSQIHQCTCGVRTVAHVVATPPVDANGDPIPFNINDSFQNESAPRIHFFRVTFNMQSPVKTGERVAMDLPPAEYDIGHSPVVLFRRPFGRIVEGVASWFRRTAGSAVMHIKLKRGHLEFGEQVDVLFAHPFALPTNGTFNETLSNFTLDEPVIGAYTALTAETIVAHHFSRDMNLTHCRAADRFPAVQPIATMTKREGNGTKWSAEREQVIGQLRNYTEFNHTSQTVCETYMTKVEDTSALDCNCFNSTPYSPSFTRPAARALGSFYMPRFTGGFLVATPTSVLRFGKGSTTTESSFLMGSGVVEFTGGHHRVLIDEIDAEVKVKGGTVVVESPSLRMMDLNRREDEHYNASERHRFSLLDGFVNFTAVAPQFIINGNMKLEGGHLKYPAQLTHSSEYKHTRGLLRVVNRFHWNGGILDGNCDLKSGGGLAIGGDTKHLHNSWQVINYAEAHWSGGNIVNEPGSTFTNKGTIDFDQTALGEGGRQEVIGTNAEHQHTGASRHLHSWDAF